MEELRQQLWEAAIKLLHRRLTETYGAGVAARCLPVAAKEFRIDHLSPLMITRINDPNAWIAESLPRIIESLVNDPKVQKSCRALGIGLKENVAPQQLQDFRDASFAYIYEKFVTGDGYRNHDGNIQQRVDNMAMDRLFQSVETYNRNHDPITYTGPQPAGGDFFIELCSRYSKKFPANVPHEALVLHRRIQDWDNYLEITFRKTQRDERDKLDRRRLDENLSPLGDEEGDEENPGVYDLQRRIGRHIVRTWTDDRQPPPLEDVTGEGTGFSNLIRGAHGNIGAALGNLNPFDVYQLWITAYLEPGGFAEATKAILSQSETLLQELQGDYDRARILLEHEVDNKQHKATKVERLLEEQTSLRRAARVSGLTPAEIQTALDNGRAYFHNSRPAGRGEKDRAKNLRKQLNLIKQRIDGKLSRIPFDNTEFSQLIENFRNCLQQLFTLQRSFSPCEALEERIDEINWISNRFQRIEMTFRPGQMEDKLTCASFRHEKARDEYLNCFGPDSNLGRYRTMGRYIRTQPGADDTVEDGKFWVRKQDEIRGILARAHVAVTQEDVSRLLARANQWIRQAELCRRVGEHRFSVFAREGQLDLVRDCFSRWFEHNQGSIYEWRESRRYEVDGNRIESLDLLQNLIWLVERFREKQFSLILTNPEWVGIEGAERPEWPNNLEVTVRDR